jgi:hypothetical protein
VLNVSPDVGSSLTVGQSAPATMTIVNDSTGADGAMNVALNSIALVPSCGALGIGPIGNCPIASRDPGVLVPSAVSGRTGTACANRTWTPAVSDMAQGRYLFVPSVQAVLGPKNDGGPAIACVLDFTVEVLKSPALDATPADGVQTNQIGSVTGQTPNGARASIGNGQTTIARRPASISAQAAPAAVALGSAIHATATLAPAAANPAGTITFSLFGPDDTTCSGAPVFGSANPVAGAGATSDDFTPATAGTYRWRASYGGDANNLAADASACDDPNATVAVLSDGAQQLAGPETAGPNLGAAAVTPPPAPKPLAIEPSVGFTTPPTTVQVAKTGSFSFAFTATPGNPGAIGLKSTKKVRIGSRTQFMRVPAKAFSAPATGRVTVKLKLSSANLKALKRLTKLKFAVTAVLAGRTFTTTVTLTPPKKT